MFRIHLFLCTQQKPEGAPCCAGAGSLAVEQAFKREIEACGLSSQAQLTTCGCTGLCQEGPIAVVYPEGIWYRRVTAADVSEIVESHLIGGKPVERLAWSDAEARQAMTLEHDARASAAASARDKAGTLPDPLDRMLRGYMPSRSVLTALELDLFTAVGEGASAAEIATRIQVDARATEMLLNALAALGLLAKENGVFRNTAACARYFARGSCDNQRDGLLHLANIWHRWSNLTEAVRLGTSIPVQRAAAPEWTRDFIAAMEHNARDRAPAVVRAVGTAGVRRILDLGGGSGIYSAAFAHASPEIRSQILDLPEVVELTAGYIERAGVRAQVAIRAGDMLRDDLGSGFDLVLLNAICHMFSPEQNRALFRRARQALAPGGRLVVQDFLLNADKAGPLQAALFSLNMLVGTEAGASYSAEEFTAWMQEAGFAEVERIALSGPSDLIVGRTP